MKTSITCRIFSLYFIFILFSCTPKKDQKNAVVKIPLPVYQLDLLELQKNGKFGKDTLVVVSYDPVYKQSKKYRAIDAAELIRNEINLSKIDPQNSKIVFECADGYKPEMPLELFLEAHPYLAYRDVDAPENTNWITLAKNGKEMSFEPFYMVYTSSDANDIHYKWPYNLVKISIEPLTNTTKELYPDKITKLEAGYKLYTDYCLSCHAINGIGGELGPDLNFPKSVTEYWKEDELVKYIVNPELYRNKVKMPNLGLSKEQSQQIVDYLKYMSGNKKAVITDSK